MLLPAALLPRRIDTVEVVGAALVAYGAGHGHRRIAARLGRPASTVRNWVRGFGRQARELTTVGTVSYYRLDANAAPITPARTPAGNAVETLGLAARAAILRFGPDQPWAVINILTGGGLLTPGGAAPAWSI